MADSPQEIYRKAFNRAMYGAEEPGPELLGEHWDLLYGTWLPKRRPGG